MKHWSILILWSIFALPLFAQEQHPHPQDSTRTHAHTLLEAFEHGHFHGHFRTFFMATDNARQLTDYHACAVGGGLHFASMPFRGFSFGIGGVFNYNLFSSDLGAQDSLTGANNRYEIGLFDIENARNRNDLDRMEEFWLRYERRNIRLTLGQQAIQTPFINHQDGRMRPTVVNGLWVNTPLNSTFSIEGGWLWRVSPRSTVRWYSVGESIGLYPRGLNPDGSSSGYPEHLESRGIGLVGVRKAWGKKVKMQVWNQYVDQIFNTVFAQTDAKFPLKNNHNFMVGLQLVRQDALASGGNEDPSKTYFSKGSHAYILSTQMGWSRGNWQALAAYTRVTADGRFLTPREWGREQFYTFMPRERIEGSGDVHAATARLHWQNAAKPRFQMGLAYGHFYLPDVRNVRLNKYAFPAFRQVNLDFRYAFGGPFEGLKAQFLYVWKGKLGDVYGNDRYVINRVDMGMYNLILNYTY